MTELRNRVNRKEGENGTEECRGISSDSVVLREKLAELMKDDPVLNPFTIPVWYSGVSVLLWALYVLCLTIVVRFCNAEWRPGVTFDPDTNEAAFRASHIAHGATVIAFIVTLMMAGIAYFWLLNPFKGIFSLTVTYISAVALTTYSFLLIYGVPGAWSMGGHRFEPVRFLEWLFTTPGMIFAIGCLTGVSAKDSYNDLLRGQITKESMDGLYRHMQQHQHSVNPPTYKVKLYLEQDADGHNNTGARNDSLDGAHDSTSGGAKPRDSMDSARTSARGSMDVDLVNLQGSALYDCFGIGNPASHSRRVSLEGHLMSRQSGLCMSDATTTRHSQDRQTPGPYLRSRASTSTKPTSTDRRDSGSFDGGRYSTDSSALLGVTRLHTTNGHATDGTVSYAQDPQDQLSDPSPPPFEQSCDPMTRTMGYEEEGGTGRRQALQSGVISRALLADVLMISFGFMDRFCEPPFRQVFFLASMVAFIATLYHFQILFGFAEGVLVDQTDRDNLKCLHRFTISVWSLFPLVRLLSLFGYLGDEAEDMLNTALDVASKLVYACSLMVVNFTVFNQVIEHRLNRTRQILQQQQQQQLKSENENEKNIEALGSVEQAYELKVLAYSEARAWREEREAVMMSQGYPSNRAAALLDSTLTEYIELSSGNLSCYLQG